MPRLPIVLSWLLLPVIAMAAPPEAAYLAARDRIIARLKPLAAGAFTPALDKAEKAGERDLEQLLRRLVGPFRMPGVVGPGAINLDTLLSGDEGFGMLDGLVYASADKRTRVVVTSQGLFDAWRKGHKDWWGKDLANVPADAADALRSEPFYTQAISTDAAVSKYLDIPIAAPAGARFATAMLALRSQDVGVGQPDEIFVAVLAGPRVFVITTPVARRIEPIAACDALWQTAQDRSAASAAEPPSDPKGPDRASQEDTLRQQGADAFRACVADHIKATPAYPALIRQAQTLVDSLPR